MLDKYREDRGRIRSNRRLTEEGQNFEIERLQKKHEILALGKSRSIKQRYEKNLQKAKLDAEKMLLQSLPKVDEHKQQLFSMRMKDLEGRVLFAPNPQAATKAIKEMLAAADEPALALQVKDRFVELSQHTLATTHSAEQQLNMRQELSELHKQVAANSRPEGAEEAAELLDLANVLLSNPDIYSGLVKDALREISKDTEIYLEKPFDYFEKYADQVKQVMLSEGIREVEVPDGEDEEEDAE